MTDTLINSLCDGRFQPPWFPWDGRAPRIILSSACIFRRNLPGILFPPFKGKDSEARKAHDKLTAVMAKHKNLSLPIQLNPNELPPYQRGLFDFLNFGSQEFLSAPDFREIYLSKDYHTVVRINDLDHLTLQNTAPGLSVIELANDLTEMLSTLESSVTFASHPYFGYLCSCGEACGTGFTAHVRLNLPGLILMDEAPKVENAAYEMGFHIHFNKTKDHYNTHLALASAANLYNCTPLEIAVKLNGFVKRLERHEINARRRLAAEAPERIADIAGRSAGMLAGSAMVSPEEAATALFALWIAGELNIRPIPGTKRNFFKLLTTMLLQQCMEAEGIHDSPLSMTPQDRAALLRTALKLKV